MDSGRGSMGSASGLKNAEGDGEDDAAGGDGLVVGDDLDGAGRPANLVDGGVEVDGAAVVDDAVGEVLGEPVVASAR